MSFEDPQRHLDGFGRHYVQKPRNPITCESQSIPYGRSGARSFPGAMWWIPSDVDIQILLRNVFNDELFPIQIQIQNLIDSE